jgi:hypothetical protein
LNRTRLNLQAQARPKQHASRPVRPPPRLSLSTTVSLSPQAARTRFARTRAPPTLSPSRSETLAARKLSAPLASPRGTRRAGRAGRHGRGELLEVRRRAAAAAGDGGRRRRRGGDGPRGDGHRGPDYWGRGGGHEPAGCRRRHGAAGRRAAAEARAPRLRRFVPSIYLFYSTAPWYPFDVRVARALWNLVGGF